MHERPLTILLNPCLSGLCSFFIHLIDVLGPSDFLAPSCMLLVQKTPSRAIRKNAAEALALPLAVLHNYSPALRISVSTLILILPP